MPSTRSSARIAANNSSSPPKSSPQSTKKTGGNKRKADSSPAQNKSKRGRKGAEKDQKTLEETLQPENGEEQEQEQEQETEQDFDKDQPTDIEMKEAASAGEGAEAKPDKREEAKTDSKCCQERSRDQCVIDVTDVVQRITVPPSIRATTKDQISSLVRHSKARTSRGKARMTQKRH